MSMLKYDIGKLISEHSQAEKLLFALWEILAPCPPEFLNAEERTVLDAWILDSYLGNGINNVLVNENYDEIANGLKALRLLEAPRLLEFSVAVENVFRCHSIEYGSEDGISMIELLPCKIREQLMQELEKAENLF